MHNNQFEAESDQKSLHDWIEQVIFFEKSRIILLSTYEWDRVPERNLEDKISTALKMDNYGFDVSDECLSEEFIKDIKKKNKETAEALIKIKKKRKKIPDRVEHIKKIIKNENQSCVDFQLKPLFVYSSRLDFREVGKHVIFRVRSENGSDFYVDEFRKYSDWNDFLEHNTLPKAYLLYPVNGKYNYGESYDKEIKLNLSKSAACSTFNTVRATCKTLSNVTLTASSAFFTAGLFIPALAPLFVPVAVATGVSSAHMMGESIAGTASMIQHKDAVTLNNPRLKDTALDFFSSVTSVAAGSAGAIARSISIESKMANFILRATGVVGTTVNLTACVDSCYTLLIHSRHCEAIINFCKTFLNFFVENCTPLLVGALVCYITSYLPLNHGFLQPFRKCSTLLEFHTEYLPSVCSFFPDSSVSGKVSKFLFGLSLLAHRNFPNLIDTTAFSEMKAYFSSKLKELCNFFDVPDLHQILTNDIPIFISSSFTVLFLVREHILRHATCSKSGFLNHISIHDFVRVFLSFIQMIKCTKPKQILKATDYLLNVVSKKIRADHKTYPILEFISRLELEKVAREYIECAEYSERYSKQSNLESEVPLLSSENMKIFLFCLPESDNVSLSESKLSRSLKKLYRKKTSHLLQKKVSKQNSKFRLSPESTSVYLFMSPELSWKATIFNTLCVDNEKVFVFATLIK